MAYDPEKFDSRTDVPHDHTQMTPGSPTDTPVCDFLAEGSRIGANSRMFGKIATYTGISGAPEGRVKSREETKCLHSCDIGFSQ